MSTNESTTKKIARFKVGDLVYMPACPTAFPEPTPERRGLTVTSVRLHEWIEGNVDRSYFRIAASGEGLSWFEGAEFHFEQEAR